MTSLFTNSEQTPSCGESGDDDLLGESAGGGDGAATEAGQVVAIGASDFLDEAELAQAFEIAGDTGGGAIRQERLQIGAAHAADVERRALQGAQQRTLGLVEEVEAFDAMAIDLSRGAVSLSRLRWPAEKSSSAERNSR